VTSLAAVRTELAHFLAADGTTDALLQQVAAGAVADRGAAAVHLTERAKAADAIADGLHAQAPDDTTAAAMGLLASALALAYGTLAVLLVERGAGT